MRKSLMLLCVLAILLAACGASSEETAVPTPVPTAAIAEATAPPVEPAATPAEPAGEQERTAIRFAVLDWELSLYEDLIAAFEEENPDLHVQVVSVNEILDLGAIATIEYPDDADRRLVSAADVVQIPVSRQTVEDGLVRDLAPFIEAEPTFDPQDFYAGALERYQWHGGTWAMPTELNFRLIFFNKDAFDQAGAPYPEAGWSWDDLLVAAKAVTEGEGGEVTRWGFVPAGLAYRLVESRTGALVDDSADPPVPRFDEEDVIDAVGWYADLYLKEQVMPYFEEEAEGPISEEQALIEQGQAAMWPETEAVWWIRSQQGNVGMVPFPGDAPDAKTSPAWATTLAMSAGTTQPDAAWRWIEFLSRQSRGEITMGIKFLPARRSAAEASGYWDDLDEEFATALRYAIDHGYMAPEVEGYGAFNDAMDAILSGEKTVEGAMVDAQAQAEASIQEAMAERAGATPAPTVAVAPSEEEPPAAEGAVTITFVPGLGSLNMDPYRDLADQFHEAYPDTVVEVKSIDLLGGSVPSLPDLAKASDCFQWYPSFQETRNREAILTLTPFLDADPSFTTDDFLPLILDDFTWQGQVWGLPADVTPYIIEYNKDLFDAAGLDYPSLDWTTDDFLDLSVALTEGEGEEKQYGFVAEVYELNDLVFMLGRLGAKLVDVDADPPALSFNDPDTVEALRWYSRLSTEHEVKPILLTDITKLMSATPMYLEREGLINASRAAMWTNTGASAALFGDRSGMNIGAAPLPAGPGATGGGYAGSSGYFISSDAENPLACWQWITFLTGEPSAVQGLPGRLSVAESDEYRQQVGAERADAYLTSVISGEEQSSFQIFSEEEWLGGALFWLGQAYGQIIDGEADVEDALDAAQKMADDYRACLVAADDFGEDTWKACVKEIDPTLPGILLGLEE